MRTLVAILSILFFLSASARGGDYLPPNTEAPLPKNTDCDCTQTGVCVCAECKCRPSGTTFEFSELDVKAPAGYTLDCNGRTCRLIPSNQVASAAYVPISAPAPAVVSPSVVMAYSGSAAYSTATRQPVRGLFGNFRPLRRIFGGFRGLRGGCGQ